MNYKKRIAKLRDERHWTSYKMAVQADIGVTTVSNWFGRNSTPQIDAIEKLCKAFGITLSEFFNEKGEKDYLTDEQRELLKQWDCLHKNEKAEFLKLFTMINENRKS